VRLLIKDEEDTFYWREITLPFVPFAGLVVRLKTIEGGAMWWDEPIIRIVEWLAPLSKFVCLTTIGQYSKQEGDVVGPVMVKLLLEAGWQESTEEE
jgi:hypothetical protein